MNEKARKDRSSLLAFSVLFEVRVQQGIHRFVPLGRGLVHGTAAADHQLQLAQAVFFQYITFAEAIKDIYKKILWALLIKMNVPVDEVKEIMGEIGGRGMGYLFENMEKMDIQAERRNTQREKERADTTELEI